MASKIDLQTLITDNLASGGAILAEAHREVENALVNEFFPTVDTYTGTNSSGVFYEFKFAKVGNIVYLNLVIRNTGALTVGAQSFMFSSLSIPDKFKSLFSPLGQVYRTDVQGLTFQVGTLGITFSETIPASSAQYRGTINYIANND